MATAILRKLLNQTTIEKADADLRDWLASGGLGTAPPRAKVPGR